MNVDDQSRAARIGVSVVQLTFNEFGFIFREQSIEDYGIDALVEVVDDKKATGKLIALQIKSGETFLKEKIDDNIVFRGELKHLQYWLSYSLPVMLVICNPERKVVYWQIINEHTITKTKKGWKTLIPLTQQVNTLSVDSIKQHAMKLSASNDYTIISLNDVSHGTAKRYTAKILLSKEYTKPELVELIEKITEKLKYREYYRNELVTQRWKGRRADVVWLFIALSLDDIDLANWVCRAQWISENLKPEYSPSALDGEKSKNGVIVCWNENYYEHSNFFNHLRISKEDFLERMSAVLFPTKEIASQVITLHKAYTNNEINETSYVDKMKKLELRYAKFYPSEIDFGLHPVECKDLSQQFQNVMTLVHNMLLHFSELGFGKWERTNRDYLIASAIEDYHKELLKLEFELDKVHR